MNTQSITYSAPGSLMLMGEHAVLYDQPAIACAVAHRLKTTLKPNNSNIIHIQSALGHLSFHKDNIIIENRLSFVTATCKKYQHLLPCGFDIVIQSNISATQGLSSSAAATLTLLACLRHYLGLDTSQHTLVNEGRDIIRCIQKKASGTDIATCCYGGTISFDPISLDITTLPNPNINAIYVGYKKPTAEVISLVTDQFLQHPNRYNQIWLQAADLTHQAQQSLLTGNVTNLANTIEKYQLIMEKIGVSDTTINEIIAITKTDDNINAAKISGSGLGDCIITLGEISDTTMNKIHSCFPKAKQLEIQLTSQGLTHEKE